MISVIIPTFNRAELLDRALSSLTCQSLSNGEFEVVVIDNGSNDRTAAVVEEYSILLNNVRYFFEPEPGLHVGRHRGMLEAKGDILVFTDDDIEALPSWLYSIQEAFSEQNVAMVGGNNLPSFLEPPPDWLIFLWESTTFGRVRFIPPLSIHELKESARELNPNQIWGCNFSIRREILLAAGGFHPDSMPRDLVRFRGDGETHVSRYVADSGFKCLFHPGASVYHKVTPERMSFDYFRQRGFNQGVSDSYTALRNQDYKKSQLGRKWSRRLIGWGLRKFKSLIMPRDVRRALQAYKVGYKNGYAYHQRVYKEDPIVREWVHKPHYFEVSHHD